MIIAKWSLLLRVWIGTTSNVTRRGRTQQGLNVVFRPYTPEVILRFLGRTHQGLFVHTFGILQYK